MRESRRCKTAFIPGAGLGTRLRPLTENCPKPLLPVGGRPVITYAMDHLITVGVERFIVNTHHRPGRYRETFPDGAWRGRPVLFRHEPVLLDTAGGLKNIEDLLAGDEAIVCYNGDVISDLPLGLLLEAHERLRPEATLALRSTGPLLNVDVNARGEVCDLRGVLQRRGTGRFLFTGICALETALLRHIEPARPSSIIDLFIGRIRSHPGSVRAAVIDGGEWTDIGSPEAYHRLQGAPEA
ncbi:MAG: nucleotidyltransferase family protein [Acidobacteriota bacterium]|jgi:NDP-sugar pyrophosphorylase family protein|nr:nucleotidyltransferase family protein [Acidobacteriota bacterium]NLT33617.1 nucleotidyltransferase family protein [Acidobacteriota bacterium]